MLTLPQLVEELDYAIRDAKRNGRMPRRIFLGYTVFERLRRIMELDGQCKLTVDTPMKYRAFDVFIVSNDPDHMSVQ